MQFIVNVPEHPLCYWCCIYCFVYGYCTDVFLRICFNFKKWLGAELLHTYCIQTVAYRGGDYGGLELPTGV